MIIARRNFIYNYFNYSTLLRKTTLSIKQQHQRCQTNWNILFFGSDNFALESLRRIYTHLSKNSLSQLEVVSSCNTTKENVITSFAKKHNIKVHSWPITFPISSFHIGIVVSFGHLIPKWIIQSFPLGMINVHASLLPRWRGAAPIIYSLIHGDEVTGVTVIKIMPNKFDIGEILAQTSIDIHPDETQLQLYDKLANIGGDLLIKTIEQLPDIINNAVPQSEDNVTYAPKITQEISLVCWNKMTAKDVYNLHRALCGLYPLITHFKNKKIKLFDIKCSHHKSSQIIPGLVLYNKKNNSLTVQCKDGEFVSVKKISLPSHGRMTANDFHNGFMNNKTKQQVIFTDNNTN